MKTIVYLKKSVIKKWLLLLAISIIGFTSFNFFQKIPVYKDRQFWEETGLVVWEVKVQQKLVALTFDDGPSPTFTDQILDLLALYNAKGTFFVIGKQAENYPLIIRKIVKEGHEIGNHTYNHPEVDQTSEWDLIQDLKKAQQVIHGLTKVEMQLFRPTSGFYNEKIVRAAKAVDTTVIIWTWGMDSRDWTGISGLSIARRLMKKVKPGDILLFHDQGGDRSNTLQALQVLIPVLKEKGYRFITVSELLKKSIYSTILIK